jgi:predicted DNA-binding transcriptional regulator AlpA
MRRLRRSLVREQSAGDEADCPLYSVLLFRGNSVCTVADVSAAHFQRCNCTTANVIFRTAPPWHAVVRAGRSIAWPFLSGCGEKDHQSRRLVVAKLGRASIRPTQPRPLRRGFFCPLGKATKMRSDKLQDNYAYAPRAMRAERAAAYLDISKSKFLELVSRGRLPRPVKIDGITSWDRFDLDAAYESMKDQEEQRRNPIEAHYGIGDVI